MGEITEMMLNGTLCEMCGMYIGMDVGIPMYCSEQCALDRGVSKEDVQYCVQKPLHEARFVSMGYECVPCSKSFGSEFSLNQHNRDKHGVK